MKIAIKADGEASSQGMETRQMSVDTRKQAKLFHMLSNTLYSDKMGSIIRELASNCYDSHIKAGDPQRPIIIAAPTLETLAISFEDTGVGLTAEEAQGTILSYLGSDKDDSDDFIGGWGIGAKSPFAYAKNYTIIITKAGVRVEYMCWKDEHGLPNSAITSQQVVASPDGVKVIVPVEARDVRSWRQSIEDYLAWTNYNVFVNWPASPGLARPRPTERSLDITLSTPGREIPVRLETRKVATSSGCLKLVYGGYSYRLNTPALLKYDFSSGLQHLSEKVQSGLDIAVVVDTPGALSFNMNREEIEDSEATAAFISALGTALSEIWEESRQRIMGEELKSDIQSLHDVQDRLDNMGETEDARSAWGSHAFKVYESLLRYAVKSQQLYTMTRHTQPQRLHSLRLLLAPVNTQIAFVYSRTLRPPRTEVYKKIDTEKKCVYVRAETRGEAERILASSADFAGFDLSGFEWIYLDNPPRARALAYRDSSTSRSHLRVYCCYNKAYIKSAAHAKSTLVAASHDEVLAFRESRGALFKAIAVMAFLENKNMRRWIPFVATPDFLRKYKDTGYYAQSKQIITDYAHRFTPISRSLDIRGEGGAFYEFDEELRDYAQQAEYETPRMDYWMGARRVFARLKRWASKAERWSGIIAPSGLTPIDNQVFSQVREDFTATAIEIEEFNTATRFINKAKLINALRPPHTESYQEARELIKTLKIEKFF